MGSSLFLNVPLDQRHPAFSVELDGWPSSLQERVVRVRVLSGSGGYSSIGGQVLIDPRVALRAEQLAEALLDVEERIRAVVGGQRGQRGQAGKWRRFWRWYLIVGN